MGDLMLIPATPDEIPVPRTRKGIVKIVKEFLESQMQQAKITPPPTEYNKVYDALLSAVKNLKRKGTPITIRARKPNIYLLKQ